MSYSLLLLSFSTNSIPDRTHYQPQFSGFDEYGHQTASDNDSMSKEPLGEYKHVFQTIFLDRDTSEHLWSKNEIKKEEIILEQWWKQQSHVRSSFLLSRIVTDSSVASGALSMDSTIYDVFKSS